MKVYILVEGEKSGSSQVIEVFENFEDAYNEQGKKVDKEYVNSDSLSTIPSLSAKIIIC